MFHFGGCCQRELNPCFPTENRKSLPLDYGSAGSMGMSFHWRSSSIVITRPRCHCPQKSQGYGSSACFILPDLANFSHTCAAVASSGYRTFLPQVFSCPHTRPAWMWRSWSSCSIAIIIFRVNGGTTAIWTRVECVTGIHSRPSYTIVPFIEESEDVKWSLEGFLEDRTLKPIAILIGRLILINKADNRWLFVDVQYSHYISIMNQYI